MADIEIHTPEETGGDNFAKIVSVLVGVIGILLAFVTIASHRAHTAAVIHRTEANDQWSFYEAKKEREHLMDVAAGLLSVVQVAQPDKAGCSQRSTRGSVTAMPPKQHRSSSRRRGARRRATARRRVVCAWIWVRGCWNWAWCSPRCTFWLANDFFPVIGVLSAVAGAIVAATNFLA